MKRKIIFGDVISIAEDASLGVFLDLASEGTIQVNYGVQDYILHVTIQTSGLPQSVWDFLIARGTDGHGDAKPIRKELFSKLYEDSFTEEVQSKLSIFLLEQLEGGVVRHEDMMEKIGELLHCSVAD